MKYRYVYLLIAILMTLSLPACSSGNDFVDEFFEIVEKDSIKEDSIQPKQNGFKLEPFFPLTKGGTLQGAAIYGDFLFHATSNGIIHVYNFKQKQYLATFKPGTMGHADTMCFGTQKVDENDEFPVLYISGSTANTAGKGGNIYAYRIVRSTDESGNDVWQGSMVQRIISPDVAIVGSYPDVVIDKENNNMWIMGWLTSYTFNHEDGSGCTNCFSKFSIPDIFAGKKDSKGVYQLTLKEEDRLSYFLVNDIHAITQGICFYNGKIVCPYGKPTVTYKGIDVVDVNKEKLIYNVNLKGSKIGEAEAAVVYDDNLYILGQGDYVYSCIGLGL